MSRKTPPSRGRPKGSRNEKTIVREVALQMVTAKKDGIDTSLTLAAALALTLERKAMQGDIPSDRALAKLRRQTSPEPEEDAGVLLVPEPLESEEWIRRQEALNLLRMPPEEPGGADPDGGPSPDPGGQAVKQPSRNGPPAKFVPPLPRYPRMIR